MSRKKQFKTESKKMLDMMVNSIYTHREIFLRELISNASDAIDKRCFRALTDSSLGLSREEYGIRIDVDKEARTLTLTDNGCGMTAEELEHNLGTIAHSGTGEFRAENGKAVSDGDGDGIEVIGQFGVGFYSAFMVSDRIAVYTRSMDGDSAYLWESEGADGYSVSESDYAAVGTRIVLHIRPDTENEKYGDFLEEWRLRELVRKYSDYIRYPIRMEVERRQPVAPAEGEEEESKEPVYETVTETVTLNSMVPLWHKKPSEVSEEEYKSFYAEKFGGYEGPARVIHFRTEGTVTYEALLFIPKKAPYNYYSRNFEKGLQLYSAGVMITERCAELLPDYFSFVRGMVDSSDLTLNISRETLQQDHQLRAIAKNLEKKIRAELLKMLQNDRAAYEDFFSELGLQLKYGVYADFGAHKETLQDLLLYPSSYKAPEAVDEAPAEGEGEKKESKPNRFVTLGEYVARMKEEESKIFYACAETVDAAAMLPQTEAAISRGHEVLYMTDDVDEFALQALGEYGKKTFANVSAESDGLTTEEEKQTEKEKNEAAEELLAFIKESIDGEVSAVRFSCAIGNHPVCLSSEGGISTEMEKVLSRMPEAGGGFRPKAETVLEINLNHPIAASLEALFATDRERVRKHARILYAQARLICGLPITNPAELSALVCEALTE